MNPLFPPWANAAVRWGVVLAAVAIVGGPVALWGVVRLPWVTGEYRPIQQPVPVDHRHHGGDDGIDCRYCHETVERSSTAGIPATGLCLNCHSQIWNSSPLLEPVRRSAFTGEPLAWRRVYKLPDFVFFNHSIHVAKGIGCESCHSRVDQMAGIYQAVPLTMGWCLSCHRNPTPNLRPAGAITAMGWAQSTPEEGRRLAQQLDVRPGTNCTTCHR